MHIFPSCQSKSHVLTSVVCPAAAGQRYEVRSRRYEVLFFLRRTRRWLELKQGLLSGCQQAAPSHPAGAACLSPYFVLPTSCFVLPRVYHGSVIYPSRRSNQAFRATSASRYQKIIHPALTSWRGLFATLPRPITTLRFCWAKMTSSFADNSSLMRQQRHCTTNPPGLQSYSGVWREVWWNWLHDFPCRQGWRRGMSTVMAAV